MSKENVQVVNQKVAEENKDKQELVLINEETIRNKIYVIRGQKVMLDFELAEIYGYTTKRFNEQVKNNIERFDEDFRFQLTKDELDIAYSAIYSKAKKSLYVIDNYIGLKTLALLKNSKEGVKNDRYIVIDYGTEQEKIFHCGPSSKDGGLRIGSIVEIREREAYHTLVDELCEMPLLELA